MSYEEKMKRQQLQDNHNQEMDALDGMTARVKALKKKVEEASQRTYGIHDSATGNELLYNPRLARRAQALKPIREKLQEKTFGTLDHDVIRKGYELESLNERQQKTVLTQYKWMADEMDREAELPGLERDEWHYPLQESFEKLSEKEQSHFTPQERMPMVSHEELKGMDTQPTFVNGDTVATAPSLAK